MTSAHACRTAVLSAAVHVSGACVLVRELVLPPLMASDALARQEERCEVAVAEAGPRPCTQPSLRLPSVAVGWSAYWLWTCATAVHSSYVSVTQPHPIWGTTRRVSCRVAHLAIIGTCFAWSCIAVFGLGITLAVICSGIAVRGRTAFGSIRGSRGHFLCCIHCS